MSLRAGVFPALFISALSATTLQHFTDSQLVSPAIKPSRCMPSKEDTRPKQGQEA